MSYRDNAAPAAPVVRMRTCFVCGGSGKWRYRLLSASLGGPFWGSCWACLGACRIEDHRSAAVVTIDAIVLSMANVAGLFVLGGRALRWLVERLGAKP